MPFSTPILFVIFNRPDVTERVFNEIRKLKPKYLYIAADGPRTDRPTDAEKCHATRNIVARIDWDCTVQHLFRDSNLGCKKAVSSAIDWFFDQVDEGIILEDDCLPDPSFFTFCSELLLKYRDDRRVTLIGGYNIAETLPRPSSYVFSKYGHIWGWATWKRAWKLYDVAMDAWKIPENKEKIRTSMNDAHQWDYRSRVYESVYSGKKDTWDYQWEVTRLLDKSFAIIPQVNLIENIGFGAEATHTKQADSSLILPRHSVPFPLIHPSSILADESYDALLRPPQRSSSTRISRMKKKLIYIAKNSTPPFLFTLAKKILKGSPKYHPRWNTLSYDPLKGVQLYFDPSGSWQKKMIDNTYDVFFFDRFKQLDLKGKVIYDIGAHIGFHSFYLARLGATLHAFEPNHHNIERFKMILEKNPDLAAKITVHDSAISDKEGTETFTVNNDIESGRSSGNFIGGADTLWTKESYTTDRGFTKINVATLSLDDLPKKYPKIPAPDILKIDVEGAEYLVLQGARHLLTTKKPRLFIEIHSMYNMFTVMSLLSELSYDSRVLRKEANGVCYLEAWPK